jgi:TRAP-type mannitol/chloroaromatic compound transport system permease large subunit
LPIAGIAFLILGGVLVGIGAATDSGAWGFAGWIVMVASAILVVMGFVARGAAK